MVLLPTAGVGASFFCCHMGGMLTSVSGDGWLEYGPSTLALFKALLKALFTGIAVDCHSAYACYRRQVQIS